MARLGQLGNWPARWALMQFMNFDDYADRLDYALRNV